MKRLLEANSRTCIEIAVFVSLLRVGILGGATGKTIVVGMLDRDERKIRAQVVPDVKRETLQTEVLKNVKYGSRVYTDNAVPYDKLHSRYVHDVVNHAETYVRGQVHTNGLENFWSLLKRNLKGTVLNSACSLVIFMKARLWDRSRDNLTAVIRRRAYSCVRS